MRLLRVVINGSTHLESVINDALDITRLENNKFEIHMEHFNIRHILNEVYEIMRFQLEQKQLGFTLRVSPCVP